MKEYEEKVRKECERVKPFIQDTIKYLKKSIQSLLPEEIGSKLKFRTVGSLELGTSYSLSTTDHCLDILLWSTEDTSLSHAVSIQMKLLEIFRLRDSDIRMRGDDISIKYYLNRRYPYLRVADPYHEGDYSLRIIFDPEGEQGHVLRHHKLMEQVLSK